MVKITFKQQDKSFTEIGLMIDKLWFEYQAEALEMGNRCYNFLVDYIHNNTKRPGSKRWLIGSITYGEIVAPGRIGFEIGDINILDEKTNRAWRAINWGSSHMVGKHLPLGHFRPGEEKPSELSFRSGRWYSSGGKKSRYSPLVKKPIPAMYFVETLKTFASQVLGKLNAKMVSKGIK